MILVSGARGILGTDLCSIWADRWKVCATDIEEMDVTDPARVFAVFEQVKPGLVIHLAAETDVDACEREPDVAFRTNALGTRNIAVACRQHDCALVYVSTISVFDGKVRTLYRIRYAQSSECL